MPKYNHIHKYQKETLGKDYCILRCVLPGCSHYIREELGIGKLSLCNRCDEPIVLTTWHLMRKKPHCESCTRTKLVGIVAEKYGNRPKKVDNTDRLKELLNSDDIMKVIK